MRKYATELIGTFFLVFTVSAVTLAKSPLAALAIGSILMVMVYAGGHISGGHYNPAVTLAVLIRGGRVTVMDAVAYVVAQIIGGLLGAWAARWVINPHGSTALSPSGRTLAAAFLVELLFTLALAYVVLNVATGKAHPDNSYYGLAIGFTILVGTVLAGTISGAAFNPAISFGGGVIGLFSWSLVLIQILAALIGAVLAAVIFIAVNADDRAAILR